MSNGDREMAPRKNANRRGNRRARHARVQAWRASLQGQEPQAGGGDRPQRGRRLQSRTPKENKESLGHTKAKERRGETAQGERPREDDLIGDPRNRGAVSSCRSLRRVRGGSVSARASESSFSSRMGRSRRCASVAFATAALAPTSPSLPRALIGRFLPARRHKSGQTDEEDGLKPAECPSASRSR